MVLNITTVNLGRLVHNRLNDLKSVSGSILALVRCRGVTLVPEAGLEQVFGKVRSHG
jgi:hypothetical protein